MISFRQKGDFSRLTGYLERVEGSVRLDWLDKYGREGVAALAAATPVDSGRTAASGTIESNEKGDGLPHLPQCQRSKWSSHRDHPAIWTRYWDRRLGPGAGLHQPRPSADF